MVGQQIGEFQIVEVIGQGGMATVYKAYQPSFDRFVALKVLPRQLSEDPTFLKRFQHEARMIARLEHRAILPVYACGEDGGMPYIVMRLLEAGSLRRKLFYEHIPLPKAVRIVEQVAEALDYAHSQGVVHRDLKPSNILLDEHDNAYLTDFGIAKMLGSTTQITASGVVGTPSYMSPEQCQGKSATPASDIYALGAILYELVTGVPPFEADTPLAVMYLHVREPVPSVQEVDSTLPPTIDRVTARAMAKKPADRYQSASALAAAFRRAVESAPPAPVADSAAVRRAGGRAGPAAVRPRPPRPIPDEPRQRGGSRLVRTLTTLLGLAALLGVIGVALSVVASLRESESNGGVILLTSTPEGTIQPTATPSPQVTAAPTETPLGILLEPSPVLTGASDQDSDAPADPAVTGTPEPESRQPDRLLSRGPAPANRNLLLIGNSWVS